MLMLCQRSEEYNHFMLERMAAACAPKLLGANRENAFRSGQFNVVVRELIAYYINMVRLTPFKYFYKQSRSSHNLRMLVCLARSIA